MVMVNHLLSFPTYNTNGYNNNTFYRQLQVDGCNHNYILLSLEIRGDFTFFWIFNVDHRKLPVFRFTLLNKLYKNTEDLLYPIEI